MKGDQGDKGDQGLAGSGFRWRGEFACDATVYQPNDVVSYEGSAWIVKSFPIGGCVAPPISPWQLFASKGAQGIQGPKGDKGDAAAAVSFRWRGSFVCDGPTVYLPGDAVSHQGSAWVVEGQATGGCVDPPHSPWQLLASETESAVWMSTAVVTYNNAPGTQPSLGSGSARLGPTIYSSTTPACGQPLGQLTTTDSCSFNACQERETDDQSSTCPDGTGTSTFASSTPITRGGNVVCGDPRQGDFINSSGLCCIIGTFGPVCHPADPPTPITTTYNVCSQCRWPFTPLGRLVNQR